MLGECPFVLLSWRLMLGSDNVRGAGDSSGDIPICDSMTNLCLHLILESVETARRTAVRVFELLSVRGNAASGFAEPGHPGTGAPLGTGQARKAKTESRAAELGSGLLMVGSTGASDQLELKNN